MMMLACRTCRGFPSQIGGVLFSCCELAYIKSINLHDNQATDEIADKQWKTTRKYRAAKWAEYTAAKALFARRVRKT